MLSHEDICRYRLPDAEKDFPSCVHLWEKCLWDQLPLPDSGQPGEHKGILIHRFGDPTIGEHKLLGAAGYDLTLGNQYRMLSEIWTLRELEDGEVLLLRPGETVVALTHEFLGLSPEFSAVLLPRALLSAQGCCVEPQWIPPTFYGRLVVTITNTSSGHLRLQPRKTRIGTSLFYRLKSKSRKSLCPRPSDSLGRRILEIPDPSEVLQEQTRLPEEDMPGQEIQVKELYDAARRYGYPWSMLYELWKRRNLEWGEELGNYAKPYARAIALRWTWQTLLGLAALATIVGVVGHAVGWW